MQNKTTYLTIFILCITITSGYAQLPFFNLTYDSGTLGKPNFFATGLLEFDSYYLIDGETIRYDTSTARSLTLTMIDKNSGLETSSLFYGNADENYYQGNCRSLVRSGNSIYGCGLYQIGGVDTSFSYIFKTDTMGNLMWVKKYSFGYDYSGFHSIIVINDTLYAAGVISLNTSNSQGLLGVFDTSGALLNTKMYGGFSHDLFYSIDSTYDNGFILAGWTKSYGNGNSTYSDGYVVKVDGSLTQEWDKTYGTSTRGDIVYAKSANDHNYFVYGIVDDPLTSYGDPYVSRTDSVGTFIWEYSHIPKNPNNYIPNSGFGAFYVADVVERSDNSVVTLYYYQDSVGFSSPYVVTHRIGMLQLLNVNGDTLFSNLLKVRNQDNYVNRIIATNDGGYVVSGYVMPDDTSNTEDGWLIKMDSNFCEDSLCIGYQIGIPEISNQYIWFLYPNPATDKVNIEFNLAENNKISVRILDVNGKIIEHSNCGMASGLTTLQVPVQALQPGMYFCELSIGSKTLVRKFIKTD